MQAADESRADRLFADIIASPPAGHKVRPNNRSLSIDVITECEGTDDDLAANSSLSLSQGRTKRAKPKPKVIETCQLCNVKCKTDSFVVCSICELSFHFLCSGFNRQTYPDISALAALFGFKYQTCQDTAAEIINGLNSNVARLTEKVENLVKLISLSTAVNPSISVTQVVDANMPSAVSSGLFSSCVPEVDPSQIRVVNDLPSNNKIPLSYSEMLKVVQKTVQKTVKDANRRHRNVILSGLPELVQTDDFDDITSITGQFKENLLLSAAVKVDGTKLIGKSNNSKPRY